MDECFYCNICRRKIPDKKFVEKHHLIPASKGGKNEETLLVCIDCGDQLHELFSLAELKRYYNTLEALLSSQKVQVWIKWVRKQKNFGICMKRKKRKK